MRVQERNIYTYDELPPEIQEKILEKNRDINVDHDWWDYIYDDAKEIGGFLGIDIDRIYYSGFFYQGDGACFEGYYRYEKDSVKKTKEYAPKDTELHRIAEGLYKIQKRNFYAVIARIKHRGRHCHEFCTTIEMERSDDRELVRDTENDIADFLRDFMRWIYKQLEKEYEYLTSDEVIMDTIVGNAWEFDEHGNLI